MCDYSFHNKQQCQEETPAGQQFCILHQPLDSSLTSEQNIEMKKLKTQIILKKINSGDFNFEGAHLTNFDCEILSEITNANFINATFHENANFFGVKFLGDSNFKKAKFLQGSTFSNATFNDVNFSEATFEYSGLFHKTSFNGKANFVKTLFLLDAQFIESEFKKETLFYYSHFTATPIFNESKFQDNVWFNKAFIDGGAFFRDTFFKGEANFISTHVAGPLFFDNSEFALLKTEETVCRFVKQNCEQLGDKEKSDEYFYREMSAKRKQKPPYKRYPEFVTVELVCGYGVKPIRAFLFWIALIFSFALLYAVINSKSCINFSEYLYFSLTTAMLPGFSSYPSIAGISKILPTSEAIIGTFFWATFVATFARKFMR